MRSRTPQIVAFLSLAGCASVTPPPAAPKPDAAIAAPARPAAIAPEPLPPPPSVQSPTPLQTSPPVQSPSQVRAPQAPSAASAAAAAKPKPQAAVAPQPKPVAPAAASQQPATPPTLDLASLEQRLSDTKAIGVFTKLSLKNQVDDLLNDFRALYKNAKRPGPDLRQRYDLLLLKVLTLLQDGDPPLASAIASSKEAIWSILSDPDKLAKI
jgi:hypothetical protein